MTIGLRRFALPLLLVLMGIWLLGGCIYIPMFGRKLQGADVSKKVGYSDSSRPLKVARASRDDVIHLLGEPFAQKADGSAIVYRWRVQNGIAIWPLCAAAESIDGHHELVLRFNSGGLLESFELVKWNAPLISIGDSGGGPPLPNDFYPKASTTPPAQRANVPQGTRYETQPEPTR